MRHGTFASLPSQCEVCRGWGAGLLCHACRQIHAPPRVRCRRCGLVIGTFSSTCGACQGSPPPFVRTVCALDYGFPWDRLITAFKFRRRVELASPLASLLEEAIERDSAQPDGDASLTVAGPSLVVPVPLARSRLAERGFNQAWELARRIARGRGLRAAPEALRRVVDTSAQAGLSSAERQSNLRNAFAPAPPSARVRIADCIAGQDVALVDDVMTTGATAREAAAALLRGGARSVHLWVLARTPAPA